MSTSARNLFDAGTVPENYRRYLEPVLFAPWAERLVRWAGVSQGDVVLDLAAGTGVVARAAARVAGANGRVIASDISSGMLEQATRAREPRAAVITPLVGSAERLDLPDASVDAVLCQQGLQFVPVPALVLRECLRVLRPGGVLAVSVWAEEDLQPLDAYADALDRSNDTVKLGLASVIDLLVGAGARDVSVTSQSLTVRWPTLEAEVAGIFGTPFGPLVERLPLSERDAVLARVRSRLGGTGGRTLDHETHVVFGRGIR